MTAPARRYAAPIPVPQDQAGTKGGSKSANNGATETSVRKLKRGGIEAHEFRRWFAPRVAAWLQLSYRSHAEVAVAFGVSATTAYYWWTGSHKASGDTAALVFLRFPDARDWFLRQWEGR